MPITANAQGKKFTFPDGTSQEQIGSAIDEFFQQDPTPAQPIDEPSALERAGQLGAETVSAANRAFLGLGDIVLSPVNVALQATGRERIEPLAEKFGEPKGAFAGEGLPTEIAAGVGELGATALAGGAAIRGLTSGLPAATSGEAAGTGVARQLAATTPVQDIAGGALAGAGQELGREVGGETGALVGGVAAPLAVAVPLSTAKQAASSLLKKAAPGVDELKNTARGIYRSLDDAGVTVQPQAFDDLVSDVGTTLKRQGIDPDLTPRATAVLNRLQSEQGSTKTLSELDILRRVARSAAESTEPSERRLGGIIIDKIDNFLDDVAVDVGGQEAGRAFRSARDLWQRARKVEVLETAVVDAQNQASGLENGLRTQFRAIAKKINSGKLKGFTTEETEAIRKVAQGTNVGNIARFLGKFGILDGVTSRSLTTLGGAGLAGAATGSPGVAAAVPLIGQVSGALSQRLTQNNAAMAQSIIKAGRNGSKIAEIYIRSTPKSQRTAQELAELFLKGDVPLNNINAKTAKPLISEAAIIAAVAKANDEKEEVI